MPQAAVVAAIPAAASVIGGAIQYRGNRNAANEQRRSTQQAIALEQQREAERQRRATERAEQRRLAFLAYYDRYGDDAIQRYGIPAGIDPGIIPSRPQPNVRPPRPVTTQPPAGPTQGAPPGATLGNIMGVRPPTATGFPGLMDSQQPTANGTLGDLGGWNDWRRLGLGSN